MKTELKSGEGIRRKVSFKNEESCDYCDYCSDMSEETQMNLLDLRIL
jgi:hypothetical protein